MPVLFLCLWDVVVKFLLQCLAVSRDTSSGLVQAHDTSAGADPPDGAQSEDGLAREGLQVEEDAEDPVKAQELRLEGNEHFKARHPSFIRHEAVSLGLPQCESSSMVARGWTDLRSTRSLFRGFALESASRRGGRRAEQGKGGPGTNSNPPFSARFQAFLFVHRGVRCCTATELPACNASAAGMMP